MINICYAGRFAVPKNNIALLHIADAFDNMDVDHVIDVYGDAEVTDKKGQEIKAEFLSRLPNKKNIRAMGFNNNLREVLIKYDFLLLPSLWEGWPLVMIEAASVGCIPVCADVKTGPREFIAEIYDYSDQLRYPLVGRGGILMPDPSESFDAGSWAGVIFDSFADNNNLHRLKTEVMAQAKRYSFSSYQNKWVNQISRICSINGAIG